MSLQFILGGSGTGKTYTILNHIIRNAVTYPNQQFIIVVPEQFTMETQKDIVTLHERHGVFNIDIVSFDRLAYRVFEEVGGYNNQIILDDIGKSMMIRNVISHKLQELKIFKGIIRKSGFIDELKSTISELYQYKIDEIALENMMCDNQDKPMLNAKLHDLLVVYKGFKEMLGQKIITTEEILDKLCEALDQSEVIRNSTIYFDGFTGFTPVQYYVLEKLLSLSKGVVITSSVDARENIKHVGEDYHLFYMSKTVIHHMTILAHKLNVQVLEHIYLKKNYRFINNEEMEHLEKNLFRFDFNIYDKKVENISIHYNKNPKCEIEYVAREINKLVRVHEFRYKDIAIITGNIELYASDIENIFQQSGIPIFVDNKRNMLNNPFIEMILALLEIIIYDFSYESVFRYAKTGLTDCHRNDIDYLENYVLEMGVRGYHLWKKDWNKKGRSMQYDLVRINHVRKQLIEPIFKVRSVFKNKKSTVGMYLKGLYEFIVDLRLQNKLEVQSNYFEKENKLSLHKEYQQIYKMAMELFDKIYNILSTDIMTPKEFLELLIAGAEQCEIGIIPLGIDQVVIGDIERTRLRNIKVLFCIGANEGIIPKVDSGGGIITDTDKDILKEHHYVMAPTAKEKTFIGQFYIYLNLTKPSHKLYITCSKLNSSGKSIRPSYLIGRLVKIYPNIVRQDESVVMREEDYILNQASAVQHVIQGVKKLVHSEISDLTAALIQWYYEDLTMRNQLEMIINAVFHVNIEKGLSKSVARFLYPQVMTSSVTRLEQYAACAFAHFLKYGLNLKSRMEFQLEGFDIGNIFHESLEQFSKNLEHENCDWGNLTDDVRERLVERSVYEITSKYSNSLLYDTARNGYIFNRIASITQRTVWAIHKQVKMGQFTPSNYEVSFEAMDNLQALNIALSNEETLKLKGRIDRIDQYADDDNVYIKVIDYKSGSNHYDFVALYHGLQLQLVVYMNVALEIYHQIEPDKKIIPAGMLYYNISDPIIEREKSDNLEEAIFSELSMNGLVSDNVEIIKMMDQNIVETKKSLSLPVSLKKDGISFTERSSVASSEQFQQLLDFVNKKIQVIGKEIIDGEITMNPYKKGKKTACDFCEYDAICQFDTKFEGNKYRKLKEYSKNEIWDKMKQEL